MTLPFKALSFASLATVLLAGGAKAAEAPPPPSAVAPPPMGLVKDPCLPPLGPQATDKDRADRMALDWPNLCRYRAANQALATQPIQRPRVVFMGDSITEGWINMRPGFFKTGSISRGISGQTTPQMLVRFHADVIALHPDAVHIMAGTNDIAGNTGPSTVRDVENNIMAMTEIAKANGVRVILASVPPTIQFRWKPNLTPAPLVCELNEWLRAYAARSGAVYADYYAVLATPDGALKPDLTYDGVHPTAAGYVTMEPIAQAAIKAALRARN